MKAFLLAAGLGTRLRPITDTLPKCLVTVAGKPMLGHWFDLLERSGVTDVLINLHHLPDQVRQYVESYSGALSVVLVMEEELLGSAGTLNANRNFVEGEEQFYILYADNLTDVDLRSLLRFNQEHPAALTMGLFHAENPSACGIATLDDTGTIIDFVEKPEHPTSDLASAGIFVAREILFDYITPDGVRPYDLGTHVWPKMIGEMNGLPIRGYLRDVGTHENLERAEREWTSKT